VKPVRLLPIVICATLALLIFKGIGLVTTGHYVLAGTTITKASEGAAPAAEAAPAAAVPADATMTDTSPTLTDSSPTLPTAPSGAADATAHDAAPPPANSVSAADTAAPVSAAPAAPGAPASGKTAAAANCAAPAPKPGAAPAADAGSTSVLPAGCPTPADAVATEEDAMGNKVPLANPNGASLTQNALLDRLGQRRAELDTREKELNMRAALVDAAEKRIEERTAALKTLQDQVSASNEQKKTTDDGQFAGIVSMYETMKPADAAAIFNNLDMTVLSRVAKMMNPRKMAPIMAKMSAARAQELTVKLASDDAAPATPAPQGNLASLPQIIGQ
jgi:flagellar motility protein MotE (MotC chaperone)